MERVKAFLIGAAKFLGFVLLIDLGIFAVVSLTCLLGTRCTNLQWSERMFWGGMLAMLSGMPAVLAAMNTSRGYFDNPMTMGMNLQVAETIIKDGRKGLGKRTRFALTAGTVGIIAIAISALIDILTR